MESSDELITRLQETETKFKRACDQVVLLNGRLEGLQRRYDKARLENHRSFRYNLRLRMATVEGVRNAFYEYACEKAERIAELRYEVSQLRGGADEWSGDDATDDDMDHDDDDNVSDVDMNEDQQETL